MLNYEGPVYRPPSEADSFIIQATIGCSWNHCTYCAMYRDKSYRARALAEIEDELRVVADAVREGRYPKVRRIFLADGDALALPTDELCRLLEMIAKYFVGVTRVSCYATARNLLEKSSSELISLRSRGLRLLYIGPESGDEKVLKSIAKGATFSDHVEGARRAHEAGIHQSLIFLLGAGGREYSEQHAVGAGRLTTEMDPRYVSLLTLTVIPDTPLAQLEEKNKFRLPTPQELLNESKLFLENAEPGNAVFRSNHASNYLPLAGRLPRDKERLLSQIDAALAGEVALRPEWARGL